MPATRLRIFISSVQKEFAEVRTNLKTFLLGDAVLTAVGDLIDRGPDSRTCVRQLIDLAGRCRFVLVRGNHEEMLRFAWDRVVALDPFDPASLETLT